MRDRAGQVRPAGGGRGVGNAARDRGPSDSSAPLNR